MTSPRAAIFGAHSLDIGGQLVRLAEKTAAAAVLWSLALVVRHGSRLARSQFVYVVCPCVWRHAGQSSRSSSNSRIIRDRGASRTSLAMRVSELTRCMPPLESRM